MTIAVGIRAGAIAALVASVAALGIMPAAGAATSSRVTALPVVYGLPEGASGPP